MPVETRVSARFGEIVREILGTDSFGQATIKTGISKAYLVEMARGKVPSVRYVQKLVDGYALPYEQTRKIMVAAGHEEPEDALSAVDMALRKVKDISDIDKEEILKLVREIAERDRQAGL